MSQVLIPRVKTVSPQAVTIFKLLSTKPAMTAQQIASELHIWPNAVYRPANKLVSLGMVQRIEASPIRFRANPKPAALNWYLMASARSFKQEFEVTESDKASLASSPSITFIKDRQNLLARTNKDAEDTQSSIDFMVSGLMVPDETILSFRKAAAKGAKIRAIVQQKQETTRARLEKWKDIGADVKYLPNIGMRMFIFDAKVVYLTSYSSLNKGSAFGIRFAYEPVARQMINLFEDNWQKASFI